MGCCRSWEMMGGARFPEAAPFRGRSTRRHADPEMVLEITGIALPV